MAKKSKGAPTGDYPVGYGRPPENGKIKPGEVRNPFGKNGKPRNAPDAFTKVIATPSRMTIDGELKIVPGDEAFFFKQLALALAGDKAAARIIAAELGARRRHASPEPTTAELKAAEEEEEQKRQLAARLVVLLNQTASAKKTLAPRTIYRAGKLVRPEPVEGPLQPDPDDATEENS